MLETIFWVSVLLVFYIYLGFPLLLFVRAKLWRCPVRCADVQPTITVVIVAHNEAAGIRAKLDNLLTSNYPQDRLDIIIGSDGSDDGTNDIVLQERRATLLALPRQGKIPALNAAVQRARGDILVFSDANSMYAPSAIRMLVRPFADPSVGGVAGSQRYVPDQRPSSASEGERAYWSFDETLKRWQAEAGSLTSSTGAIYAIRRELFKPVPSGVGDDAVISYRVVASGHRMVFAPAAVAFEPVAPSEDAEFQRKVRVCARGLRGLLVEPELFNPFRHGFYTVQLVSHKLLRWLGAWPLMATFVASLFLSSRRPIYGELALVQAGFYLAAGAVVVLPKLLPGLPLGRILTLPFYFCLANVAFLAAQFKVVQGQHIDRWEVRRGTTAT